MKTIKQFAVNFLKNEDGPTAVEYAVMLALIIVVCIGAITTLGKNANGTFTSVGTAISSTSSSRVIVTLCSLDSVSLFHFFLWTRRMCTLSYCVVACVCC